MSNHISFAQQEERFFIFGPQNMYRFSGRHQQLVDGMLQMFFGAAHVLLE